MRTQSIGASRIKPEMRVGYMLFSASQHSLKCSAINGLFMFCFEALAGLAAVNDSI